MERMVKCLKGLTREVWSPYPGEDSCGSKGHGLVMELSQVYVWT